MLKGAVVVGIAGIIMYSYYKKGEEEEIRLEKKNKERLRIGKVFEEEIKTLMLSRYNASI